MKRFLYVIIFTWYVLIQGYGQGAQSTGSSAVVGPFQTKKQCEAVANEAIGRTGNFDRVVFRASSCWEVVSEKNNKR